MADDARARAVERVQKLLRLAAPSNGTTEAERASAALEVAKIIAEHGLAVAIPPPVVKKRRAPPQAQPAPPSQPAPYQASSRPSHEYRQWAPPSGSDWTEIDVPARCNCVICGRLICAGEVGWFAPDHGYRHYDITCDR